MTVREHRRVKETENSGGEIVPEKRMLIVDADVARKIEENRGDMSYSEFISFLIDSNLKADVPAGNDCVSKEEFQQFRHGMKDLLRSFLEFFLSYGLELGKQPPEKTFEELNQKLQHLSSDKR